MTGKLLPLVISSLDRPFRHSRNWQWMAAIYRFLHDFNALHTRRHAYGTCSGAITLQMRSKLTSAMANLKPGQVALIHKDNSPPQHWLTGRIINSIVGEDNRVRVVDIQTLKGVIPRPICNMIMITNPI